MATQVEEILEQRRRQGTSSRGLRFVLVSVVLHAVMVALFWIAPSLFARTPEPIEYVDVVLVPAAMLGAEEPPPPPPPEPPPKQPEPEPVPVKQPEPEPLPPPPKPVTREPPPPEPVPADVPVLPKKPEKKPEKKPPPPPPPAKAPPPAASPIAAPPRRGSPLGNPLGIATAGANVGVEDPNFTYDYYTERIRAAIGEQWVRPPVGGEAVQALIYFRILKDGTVSAQRLVESSGSEVFDQAAMRAVRSASMPPLPRSYDREHLGVQVLIK